MTAPALASYVNGIGQVSADNYNTFMQTCDTAAQLRGFAGIPGIEVYMRGFLTIGDGGQGIFYWNANGTAADDGGVTTIVPSSSTAGVWTRLSSVLVKPYSIQVPVNGFSITIATGINLLVLNPAAALATGTVIMPEIALDGQSVTISVEQTITAITISGNAGQTIVGAPTTLAQFSSITFTYNLANRIWYFADSGGGGSGGGGSTTANALASLTTTINVSSATAPTSGQVLTATSDSTATWQAPAAGGSGALILLNTQPANSLSSIAFSSTFLTNTYTHYIIIFNGAYTSATNPNLYLTTSTNNGSSYSTTGYSWSAYFQNAAGGTVTSTGRSDLPGIELTGGSTNITSSANTPASGTINIFDISAPTPTVMLEFSANGFIARGGGSLPPGTINNIKIAPSSGVITGTFKLYGVV